MHSVLKFLLLAASLCATVACGNDQPREARAETAVDSVLSREEALARFQSGLVNPETLLNAQPSREALVGAFVRALEASDTAALTAMALSRAEFAYLYYETNPEALPPYDLSPGLMWELLELRGRRGLHRLLEQRAGQPLGYAGLDCEGEASVQGENRVVGPCTMRRRDPVGTAMEERLFGLIVERGGRFKFVSLANPLD